MTTKVHTPKPWKVDRGMGGGNIMIYEDGPPKRNLVIGTATEDFIELACKPWAIPQLVEALKLTRNCVLEGVDHRLRIGILREVDAALAAVEEGKP